MSEEYWRKEAAFVRKQRDATVSALESQLAAMKAKYEELEVRYSGKTFFCGRCERYAKSLEAIKKHLEISIPKGHQLSAIWNIAKEALLKLPY